MPRLVRHKKKIYRLPIVRKRTGTPFPGDIGDAVVYNLEDQIGSSVTRLNTSGAVIDKEEYYPFGDSSLRTFSSKRYRYVGKEKDLESGLYYYGARYYAAWTCRFISVDPLAAKYNYWSSYVYAGNNPIMFVDINGEGPDGGGGKSASLNGSGGGSNSIGNIDKSDSGSKQINGIKATQEGADIYMRSFENTLGEMNPFHYDTEKGGIIYDNDKLENAKNIATCTQLEIIDATVLLIESDDSSINVVKWNEELSFIKDENNTLEKRKKIAETVTKIEDGKFVGADIYIARDAQIPTGNFEQIFDGIDENGQPKYKEGNEKYRGITEHELSVAALHEIYHPYIHFTKPELSIILGHEEHNLLVEDFENRIREIYKTGNKIVTRRIKNYGKIKYSIPTYIGGKALSHSKPPNEK